MHVLFMVVPWYAFSKLLRVRCRGMYFIVHPVWYSTVAALPSLHTHPHDSRDIPLLVPLPSDAIIITLGAFMRG